MFGIEAFKFGDDARYLEIRLNPAVYPATWQISWPGKPGIMVVISAMPVFKHLWIVGLNSIGMEAFLLSSPPKAQ
jgi:hypothetical protein